MLISLIAFLVILSDYFTKKAIVAKVMPFDHINVLPFLRIVHVENKGAAFGLFAGLGNIFFMTASVIAIIVVLFYIFRFARGLEVYSLSLIFGGAIGNLLDRIRYGKVIDFIDIYVGEWHWPAFNVADSALTVGIILFIGANLLSGKARRSG
ncbi:MAG: signal peptidase II [Nitrospirae bacterium]|nr:signal peptidase II [Nitrospirota bacterium]